MLPVSLVHCLFVCLFATCVESFWIWCSQQTSRGERQQRTEEVVERSAPPDWTVLQVNGFSVRLKWLCSSQARVALLTLGDISYFPPDELLLWTFCTCELQDEELLHVTDSQLMEGRGVCVCVLFVLSFKMFGEQQNQPSEHLWPRRQGNRRSVTFKRWKYQTKILKCEVIVFLNTHCWNVSWQ